MRTTGGCKAFLLSLLLQGYEAQIRYQNIGGGKCENSGYLTIKSSSKCVHARSTLNMGGNPNCAVDAPITSNKITVQNSYEGGYAYGCSATGGCQLFFQSDSSSQVGCTEWAYGDQGGVMAWIGCLCETGPSCQNTVAVTPNPNACICGSKACTPAGGLYCFSGSSACSPGAACENTNGESENEVDCSCGTRANPKGQQWSPGACNSFNGMFCSSTYNQCSSSAISVCSDTDGNSVNSQTCICGTKTCNSDNGLFCHAGQNHCSKECSTCGGAGSLCLETDGTNANSAECICGTASCTDTTGRFCDYSVNICSSGGACPNNKGALINTIDCSCGTSACNSVNGMFCTASLSRCSTIQFCPNDNGASPNSVACPCGTNDCSTNQYCSSSDSRCSSVQFCPNDDGASPNAAACPCGTANCDTGTGLYCISSLYDAEHNKFIGFCAKACDLGQYRNAESLGVCTTCAAGQYADDVSDMRCKLCPAGTNLVEDTQLSSNHNELSDCKNCPALTYVPFRWVFFFYSPSIFRKLTDSIFFIHSLLFISFSFFFLIIQRTQSRVLRLLDSSRYWDLRLWQMQSRYV